eukprot:gene30058-39251_t
MYQLLTSEWGVSDRFAVTLIDHYGRNIWDMYLALMRLSRKRYYFYAVDPLVSSHAIECLDWKGNQDGHHEKMVEALRLPIRKYNDPIATVISANNIGDIVFKGSVIIGLPDDVWKSTDCKHGIVPSIVIAEQLMQLSE